MNLSEASLRLTGLQETAPMPATENTREKTMNTGFASKTILHRAEQ